jgi:hypothetical protein
MKKSRFVLSAATALVAATVGLAAPAIAAPPNFGPPQDDPCTVHVLYQGSIVDVKWC